MIQRAVGAYFVQLIRSWLMRIERLIAHQVGPFDDLDITFPECPDSDKAELHMFVGPNGSGKSTVLYALAQTFGAAPLAQRLRGPESYVVVQCDGLRIAMVPHDAPDRKYRLKDLLGSDAEALYWRRGASIFHYSSQARTLHDDVLPADYVEARSTIQYLLHAADRSNFVDFVLQPLAFAGFAYSGSRTLTSHRLTAVQELATDPLEHALSFTRTADPERLVQWIANTKAKEALALARGDAALAQRRGHAIAQIERAVSRMIEQEIRFVLSEEPLDVRVRQNGIEVAMDVLPDGLKSVMSWVADLLMRLDRLPWLEDVDVLNRSFALFLDEIEIHMHPAWQRKILPVVQTLFPKAQIFLSTHSPFAVGSVSSAWIHPLTLKSGKASYQAPLPARVGESYPTILAEVFGVEQEFDIETEEMFRQFHDQKRRLLAGDTSVQANLESLADTLRQRSVETRDIVEHEMRQLRRHLEIAS